MRDPKTTTCWMKWAILTYWFYYLPMCDLNATCWNGTSDTHLSILLFIDVWSEDDDLLNEMNDTQLVLFLLPTDMWPEDNDLLNAMSETQLLFCSVFFFFCLFVFCFWVSTEVWSENDDLLNAVSGTHPYKHQPPFRVRKCTNSPQLRVEHSSSPIRSRLYRSLCRHHHPSSAH